ncbi:MAG: AAA family ATPase [Phycisphaerae bacterium]|nr:AAA family ATPase [Gemmatimonadaceae bacterium]
MTSSIAGWLEKLGLAQYATVFAENDIDLEVMPNMTELDLEKLGVSMGHRKKIIAAIAGLPGVSATAPNRDRMTTPSRGTDSRADAGERRQLTVMFCDLVGSTALAEQLDPEDLREVIRAYQQCAASVIERFDGHIAQYLGDGLLVYFGHPHAHEDDAERAVRAGMGIVAELQELVLPPPFTADSQLAVRIGIHTGLIVIANVGDDMQQLALGDTPNIAARLQGLALPGTTVISNHTQRLIAGKFECEDLGLQPIKGIREPVRAWTVTGVSEAASRFEAATLSGFSAFVGREAEAAHMVDRWQQAVQGYGQVVLLSGEAGIGKSRILEEVRQQLGHAGTRAIQVQCSPYHINSAYYPITHELARYLKFRRHESATSKLDRLDAVVIDKLSSTPHDAALIASMLSIDAGMRYDAPVLPAMRQKKETVRALVDLVQSVANRAPTLVLLEDVHWADPTSLEVLDELILRSATMRVLIIITHRPEFQNTWSNNAHVTTRALSRLSHAESAALIARVTEGKLLAPVLMKEIIAKADGVPLFVEELTKFLLESNRVRDKGGTFEYTTGETRTSIPATLRDSLMARLDRVAPVKEIAQMGAAIGREFSYDMIGAVSNMPTEALDAALAALTESGLAIQHRRAPDAAYTFKHALVQEVAYASMLNSRRQALHRTIAGVLEERHPALCETDPELFAHHTSAAGLVEVAIPYWRKAASLSLSRMALSEATSQLSRGLELVGSLPVSAERDRKELPFHALLGTTHMLSKGWGATEVQRAYGRANELCKSVENAEETIWPLWGVWVYYLVRGEMTRAREIADRIASLALASNSRTAALVSHMIFVQVDMYSGQFAHAERHVALGRALYRDREDLTLIGLYTTDLLLTLQVHQSHLSWFRGLPDEAATLCEENDEFARSLDHPYSISWALTWGAIPHLYRGDITRLLANVDQGIRIAEEFGFAYTAAIGTMARGWGIAQRGDLESGIEQMRDGLNAFNTTGSAIVIPFFQTLLAELLGLAGRKWEGLALLESALAQVEEWGERWQESEIHRTRGQLFAQSPDADVTHAELNFQRAISVAHQQSAPAWELRATLSLGRLLHSQHRDAEARQLLEPALAAIQSEGDTADVRDANALLLTLAQLPT